MVNGNLTETLEETTKDFLDEKKQVDHKLRVTQAQVDMQNTELYKRVRKFVDTINQIIDMRVKLNLDITQPSNTEAKMFF